jgi:hypothetical protein
LSNQTGQASLAKTAASKLQKRKCHRPNEESTSQISSLPFATHGKCLIAKDKKKKKAKKVESEEEEEEDDAYDLDFDNPSKKDMVKIKRLFERLQEEELQLEEINDIDEDHEKLKHTHTSLIGKHEKSRKAICLCY